MGANAQTSVPAFTAGQVLTAQQQTEINTGIPVFATTTTRDAAFGGTGEKTLAEGQMAYIENIAGSSAVQYYDGAAWQTLVISGLNYVTGTSFSAVSSVSLPTSTFTSTYRNYRIIFEITSASTDIVLTGRLRASGADLTGANYNTGYYQWSSGGAAVTFNDVNQTSAKLGMGISSAGVNQSALIMDIISPQLTDVTIWSSSAFYQPSSVGSIGWSVGGGLYNVATAADSFSLIANTGNITGVYRVYGYSES